MFRDILSFPMNANTHISPLHSFYSSLPHESSRVVLCYYFPTRCKSRGSVGTGYISHLLSRIQ